MKHAGVLLPVLFITGALLLAFATSSCNKEEGGAGGTTAITGDLFPLVAGRHFVYTGYAISTAGTRLSDPGNVFRTVWAVDSAGVIPNSTLLRDTTTLYIAGIGTVIRIDSLYIRKDTVSGDFEFLSSLGLFFRSYKITPRGRTDTTRWIAVARKSAGLTGTWVAFDSSYTDSLNARVRLQISGAIEAQEAITDSSSSHTSWSTYRCRTYRNIYVNDTLRINSSPIVLLWLAPDVGPIQIHIYETAENFGYFRVMKSKNF